MLTSVQIRIEKYIEIENQLKLLQKLTEKNKTCM